MRFNGFVKQKGNMVSSRSNETGYSFSRGIKDGIPIALGYLSVSFTFGMAAVSSGSPVSVAVLISMTNLTSAGPVCRAVSDCKRLRAAYRNGADAACDKSAICADVALAVSEAGQDGHASRPFYNLVWQYR